jgi:hypothetical protein
MERASGRGGTMSPRCGLPLDDELRDAHAARCTQKNFKELKKCLHS